MNSPGFQKLTKQDAANCRALKSIITKGKFEVQGEAMVKVASLFLWLENLDKRIDLTLDHPGPIFAPIHSFSTDSDTKKKAKK